MEYPDSSSGLVTDGAAQAHIALFDESFAVAGEKANSWSAATAKKVEVDTFIDLPDPYLAAHSLAFTANRELSDESDKDDDQKESHREKRQRDRKDDNDGDWLKGACDWVSGAVDVATQVVVGAAESVYVAVTEHPWETAAMVAQGVAIGAVIVGAAPVAGMLGASAAVIGGITLATDIAVVGLTAAGAVHATQSVAKAVDESAASADILMNKSDYSEGQIQEAREHLQDKTGSAAIEAGFTLTMVGGAIGPSMRLASRAQTAFSSRSSAVSALTDAPIAPAKDFGKLSNDGNLTLVTKDATPSDMLAMQKSEAPWVRRFPKENKAENLPQLPADVAPQLLRKIDDVIEERQAQFDIKPQSQRIKEIDAMPLPEIAIRDAAGGVRSLTKEELLDYIPTRELLRGGPHEKHYDAFLKTRIEKFDLTKEIEPELILRRNLVENILNESATELFPNGTFPSLKVKHLQSTSRSEAGYLESAMYLKDEFLIEPTFKRGDAISRDAANVYSHEMTHGEQDGVILRNLIDTVTGGDTTGKRLSNWEVEDVINLGFDRMGWRYTKELIQDINLKRDGKLLSPEETARAQRLQTDRRKLHMRDAIQKENEAYLERLSDELVQIQERGITPETFAPERLSSLFKGQPIPEEISKINMIFDSLLKPNFGKYSEAQEVTANNLKSLLTSSFRFERDRVAHSIKDDYADYKSWFHEQEAWEIGGQAAKQVKDSIDRDIMFGDRLQSSVDEMMLNPIDYSSVLVY